MIKTRSDAVRFIDHLLLLPEVSHSEEFFENQELTEAIRNHDTRVIFRVLMDGFSLQGISDERAFGFIEKHGNADWDWLTLSLKQTANSCEKLSGFASFYGCRYRKSQATCGNPAAIAGCPVPRMPLRKGILNEQAVSLYFFINERCSGDIIGFIDGALSMSTAPNLDAQREFLVSGFCEVAGVSKKLANMMLATLLMAAPSEKRGWFELGSTMVVVDSLVHNFLHRTGMLRAYDAQHSYGPRCYGGVGCETVLRDIVFSLEPQPTPRSAQHAIWRFCATGELSICNGININDRLRCDYEGCPLREHCCRLPLRSTKPEGRG